MQFSLSSLLALTLTLTLAGAAPAASLSERQCSNTIYVGFEGADAATAFSVPVCVDGGASQVGEDNLSISYINYDRNNYYCTFTAEFDTPVTPATATYVCNGDNCQVGPPQPIYTVQCGTCSYPDCDGYSA